jgi:hypothetical protein
VAESNINSHYLLMWLGAKEQPLSCNVGVSNSNNHYLVMWQGATGTAIIL